ncbi:hypothetical protein MLD38_033624 [Melastoma candidum]|uniref:Uncharacterized protein n=1 Tax=Melastoma candidum TaxID=119954 RepID=A0ACB9M763_9MYRT|nr:hypothetical protein MLD38_033624 [Melastoma candidum]
MASVVRLPCARLLLLSSFLQLGLVAPLALASPARPSLLTSHRGPILHGNVNLALIWYGPFGRVHKNVVRSFIKSLNIRSRGICPDPQVSSWWKVVESYQSGSPAPPPIRVQVVRQVTDVSFSVGKVLTKDFFPPLIQKATGGNPNVIAVLFTNRDVTVQGLCMGDCYVHGLIGRQPYIIVGDPQNECPGSCAWPFHQSDYGPMGAVLRPPNGNVGADSMVVNLASALAATVTNPYGNGYFKGPPVRPTEAASACPKMFGSRAFPGYTGKVRVNPVNGGGFNVQGYKGRKFLLPAIWNPRTAKCWTPL